MGTYILILKTTKIKTEKVRETLHCLFERVMEQGPVRKKSGISDGENKSPLQKTVGRIDA